MILTGKEILREVKADRIKIDPFDPRFLTTNSYDLNLGEYFIRYTSKILDPKKPAKFRKMKIPKRGMVLKKNEFILGSTRQRVGSDFYVPIIHAKSGVARMGLFVHVTADLIDIGSHGNSTLQLYATLPIKLYPGMPIAQVSFWVPKGDIVLYSGKYQNSVGPQPSLIYKNFK